MRIFAAVTLAACAALIAVDLSAVAASPSREVQVTNFPSPQFVEGSVEVTNFPEPSSPARFQLVGFTTATFTGGEGVLGFTLACQAEFPGSRMCSSVEVMGTTVVPASLTGEAWVRPVMVPFALASGGAHVLDAAGIVGSPSQIGCDGWRTGTGNTGLSIYADGRFTRLACYTPRAVTCCAPVP